MKHDYYDHDFLHFLFADYKEIETTRTGEHFLPLSEKIIWIGRTHQHTEALNHLVVSNFVEKSDLFSRKRRGQLSSHFLLRPCDETLPKQLGPEAKGKNIRRFSFVVFDRKDGTDKSSNPSHHRLSLGFLDRLLLQRWNWAKRSFLSQAFQQKQLESLGSTWTLRNKGDLLRSRSASFLHSVLFFL